MGTIPRPQVVDRRPRFVRGVRMTGLPTFWTEADEAELDVLTHTLVAEFFEHRERCDACQDGSVPCPHLQAAIREVCDWREARVLLSRAQAFRIAQDEADEAAA